MEEYLTKRHLNLATRINCIQDRIDSGMCESKEDYHFCMDKKERLGERLMEIESIQLMSKAFVNQN